jgi:hypothetical protein
MVNPQARSLRRTRFGQKANPWLPFGTLLAEGRSEASDVPEPFPVSNFRFF